MIKIATALAWSGIDGVFGLAAIGSILGRAIAGQAAIEAYPAHLDSAIEGLYERASVIRTNGGSVGSLTMMGTVSPAGGNFEEPVTQATLAPSRPASGFRPSAPTSESTRPSIR